MAWGYPNKPEDYPSTVMISVSRPDVIAYVFFEFMSEDTLLLHMGAHPDWRGTWMSAQVCMKIAIAAELLGARRVYVITSDEGVNRLCVKYGFIKDSTGYYLNIGG
jgi:hypothetical protein